MSFTQNYEESWKIYISSIDLIRFGLFLNLGGVLEKTSFSNRETSAQTIGLSWSLVAGVIPAPSLLIQPTRCQCLSSCFTPATTIITYTLKGYQLPLSRKNCSFQETRITASHDFLLGSFRNATTWKCKKKAWSRTARTSWSNLPSNIHMNHLSFASKLGSGYLSIQFAKGLSHS